MRRNRGVVMTVKELKEKLNKFDDNLLVMIPNRDYHLEFDEFPDIVATNVSQGVNEADGAIFIEHWEEDDDYTL